MHSEYVENDAVEWWEGNEEDQFRPEVFDLEVDGLHTYHVGRLGTCVHDCTGTKFDAP